MLDNSHSTMSEGTDAGIIGGLAVALWFLILDTLAGQPFQTPSDVIGLDRGQRDNGKPGQE